MKLEKKSAWVIVKGDGYGKSIPVYRTDDAHYEDYCLFSNKEEADAVVSVLNQYSTKSVQEMIDDMHDEEEIEYYSENKKYFKYMVKNVEVYVNNSGCVFVSSNHDEIKEFADIANEIAKGGY